MAGFIYIMSNPSFSDANLLKIGRTDRHPEERAKELSGTSTPLPFVVEFFSPCTDSVLAESVLHGWLHRHRASPNREFFRIEPDHAISLAVRACQHAEMMSLNAAMSNAFKEAEKEEPPADSKPDPEASDEMDPEKDHPVISQESEPDSSEAEDRKLLAFFPGFQEYAYNGEVRDVVEVSDPDIARIIRAVRATPTDASIRELCRAAGRTPGGRQAERIKRLIREHAPRMYRDRFGG